MAWIVAFIRRTSSGGPAAARPAIVRAASSSSASGTQVHASPISAARATVDDLAEHHQGHRRLQVGDAPQPPGVAAAGVQADLQEAGVEAGGLAGDDQVAGQGHVEPGTDGGAVHRRHAWAAASRPAGGTRRRSPGGSPRRGRRPGRRGRPRRRTPGPHRSPPRHRRRHGPRARPWPRPTRALRAMEIVLRRSGSASVTVATRSRTSSSITGSSLAACPRHPHADLDLSGEGPGCARRRCCASRSRCPP